MFVIPSLTDAIRTSALDDSAANYLLLVVPYKKRKTWRMNTVVIGPGGITLDSISDTLFALTGAC